MQAAATPPCDDDEDDEDIPIPIIPSMTAAENVDELYRCIGAYLTGEAHETDKRGAGAEWAKAMLTVAEIADRIHNDRELPVDPREEIEYEGDAAEVVDKLSEYICRDLEQDAASTEDDKMAEHLRTMSREIRSRMGGDDR